MHVTFGEFALAGNILVLGVTYAHDFPNWSETRSATHGTCLCTLWWFVPLLCRDYELEYVTLAGLRGRYVHLIEADILPQAGLGVQSQITVLDLTTTERARLSRSASDRAGQTVIASPHREISQGEIPGVAGSHGGRAWYKMSRLVFSLPSRNDSAWRKGYLQTYQRIVSRFCRYVRTSGNILGSSHPAIARLDSVQCALWLRHRWQVGPLSLQWRWRPFQRTRHLDLQHRLYRRSLFRQATPDLRPIGKISRLI